MKKREVHPLALAAVLLAAAASLATSSTRLVRNYPAWQIEGLGARTLDCAIVDLWVSKSGKQGFGVTFEVVPKTRDCRFAIRSAHFSAGSFVKPAAKLPEPRVIARRQHFYVPFAFDNEALWNAEIDDGRLELELEVGARRERVAFGMRHVWEGPQRIRPQEEP